MYASLLRTTQKPRKGSFTLRKNFSGQVHFFCLEPLVVHESLQDKEKYCLSKENLSLCKTAFSDLLGQVELEQVEIRNYHTLIIIIIVQLLWSLTVGLVVLPDKPTNLTVTDITSKSAKISWQDSNDRGKYAPSRVWIKVKKEGSLIFNITTEKVNEYEINNLASYTTYEVFVAAGNVFGFGEEAVISFSTLSEKCEY